MINKNFVRTLVLSKVRNAFVLVGRCNEPYAAVLTSEEMQRFTDHVVVVGCEKANKFTFGIDVINALPCTVECMQFIALNYVGAHEEALKAMCARIALGLPLDDTEGGLKVESAKPIPRKPSPSAAKHIAAAQRIAATQASV